MPFYCKVLLILFFFSFVALEYAKMVFKTIIHSKINVGAAGIASACQCIPNFRVIKLTKYAK